MKDSRKGEALWKEWTGDGYDTAYEDSVIFFTDEHVDIENEVVRRALASTIQRDGLTTSLGLGFKALEDAQVSFGYAGEIDGDIDLTVCDEEGETCTGDVVDHVVPITFVEVSL